MTVQVNKSVEGLEEVREKEINKQVMGWKKKKKKKREKGTEEINEKGIKHNDNKRKSDKE